MQERKQLKCESKNYALTPFDLIDDVGSKTVVELAKVLGVYRTEFLYKQHQMLKLPLSNPSYEEEFLDNVHCT